MDNVKYGLSTGNCLAIQFAIHFQAHASGNYSEIQAQSNCIVHLKTMIIELVSKTASYRKHPSR